jgi:hypothetical protein
MTVTGLEGVPDGLSGRKGLTAEHIRNKASNYFLTSAGVVPWQM